VKTAKVCHVITKLELGGAQKVTLMTLERLPRDRYDVTLVTGPEGLLRAWAERIPELTRVWMPSLVREVRPLQDLAAFVSLWRLFRRERPDIVHTHSSKAGILGRWAARLAGVPFVFHTAHGFGFTDFQRPPVRALYLWLERMAARISTKVVVVSHANADVAERNGVLKRGDWILCRDAIDVRAFLAETPRRRLLADWGIAEGETVVGMVACFKPQKAPVDFIEVAARVLRGAPGVRFVMAGDGELRGAVEARIRELGLGDRITLLGWLREDGMPEFYRNLDIVVLTSLWEGLPCVFSEAMAAELPIVATHVDGAREAVIDGESGFLHPPHDVDGMSRSVLKLLAEPSLRRRMGEAGRARAMEFDISLSVSTLEAAYRDCIKT
jgi:glycosyltransferase involved in cell wall biosynthesis